MSQPLDHVLQALRAIAEPTRLRLFALLAEGELTVSEICEVVGQSQPRVSRHLKVLCDAGLLDRFREEHWVYYRIPARGAAAEHAAQFLHLVPEADAVLRLDRERRERIIAARVEPAALSATSRKRAPSIEEFAEHVLAELGPAELGDLLDIGTGEGDLLRTLAPGSRYAVGIDISTDRLRVARTQLHVAGLGRCEVKRGDMHQLEFPDGSFDTVTMDRVLAETTNPVIALREAARVLRPGGRLLIVDDFDRLLASGIANPLNGVRNWLAVAGLDCRRLHPVDTTAGHLLIAIGESPRESEAAA